MKLFDSRLMNRIAVGKLIGLVMGGAGFFLLPVVFAETDMYLRLGIWAWYITLGAIIGVFGVMDKVPLLHLSFPWYLRGAWIGAWMNLVLFLLLHDRLHSMMDQSFMVGYPPVLFVIEGLIFGLIVDYFATKYSGEGKKIVG